MSSDELIPRDDDQTVPAILDGLGEVAERHGFVGETGHLDAATDDENGATSDRPCAQTEAEKASAASVPR